MSKTDQLKELHKRWANCQKCGLHEKRKSIVFGQGDPDADILVLGIGPGEEEDREGVPFYGPSGEILDDFLTAMKFDRRELFIMNLVGCRPTIDVVDPVTNRKRVENRDPSTIEREACYELFHKTLYIVDPMLIIALGKPVMQAVSGLRGIQMYKDRGEIFNCEFPGLAVPVIYPVMCMYHPAFLARTGDKTYNSVWHQTLVDWYRAIHYIDQLRYLYRGEPPPDRGYTKEDMFIHKED